MDDGNPRPFRAYILRGETDDNEGNTWEADGNKCHGERKSKARDTGRVGVVLAAMTVVREGLLRWCWSDDLRK